MKHRPDHYNWIIEQFNRIGITPIIIAGQAVNLWSSLYREWDTRHNPTRPRIDDLLPLTSSDMEFLDTGIVHVLETFTGVVDVSKTVPFQHTASPDLATIHLERNKETFKIQVMVQVLGATNEEIIRNALPAKINDGDQSVTVKVIDPITLLKCKIQNLLTLDQKTPTVRHDERHVKLSTCCIRAFIAQTATNEKDEKATRHALNLIEAVRELTKTKAAKQVAKEHGIVWSNCIPLDIIEKLSEKDPKWQNFLRTYSDDEPGDQGAQGSSMTVAEAKRTILRKNDKDVRRR